MSRYSGGSSTHHIQNLGKHWGYRISWTFDTHIQGSRLRWPRTLSRDTDRAGAERFAKKWGIEMPEESTTC